MIEQFEGRIAFRLQRRIIARTFRQQLGYAGNFENPKTYQEKIQYRKLYGNHAFYASVADKYAVRSYIAQRVGEKYLIPLLGSWDRLEESTFEGLPNSFIIKANHGCKWDQVVLDKNQLDIAATVRYFNGLRHKGYGWASGERHYNFIRPKVVIEQLLRDPEGGLPWDYSFFSYNGPSGFDYALGMTSPDGKGAHFDKNWNIVESEIPESELKARVKPPNHAEMLEVARQLSADFDFVRVDLYNISGAIYFGELTCTPSAGFGVITNKTRQRLRDVMWHLDADNPLLYCGRETRQSCIGEWATMAIDLTPWM